MAGFLTIFTNLVNLFVLKVKFGVGGQNRTFIVLKMRQKSFPDPLNHVIKCVCPLLQLIVICYTTNML